MIKAIVTDIEGTTTALDFVKEVLFPFARTHMAEFIKRHHADRIVKGLLADVSAELKRELSIEDCITQLIAWIDEDQKITPLKALQGLIWEDGYHRGAFAGHLYPDVLPNLRRWQAQGIALYVYSSGSVHAQKLLFGHTAEGDLTPLFNGYFDTEVGGKKEPASYTKIAERAGLHPHDILFLSDLDAELDAAKAAGFNTIRLCRDSIPEPDAKHPQVADFDAIQLELPVLAPVLCKQSYNDAER